MYVKIHVTVDAKKELVNKVKDDLLEISVREPAERNLANSRVKELVASYFKIPAGKVKIVSGHHHPHKIFSIDLESKN